MEIQLAPLPLPTVRELEVLNLICEGYSTKEIAYDLGISFKTAACHRYRLMDKANADNVILLFRWALLNGHVTVKPKPKQCIDAASATASECIALSA